MKNLTDTISYYVAAVVFIFSWILFYRVSNELINSFFVACMAAGIAWISYVLVRWAYLAARK